MVTYSSFRNTQSFRIDQGNFVEILKNGSVVQVPVTLGISDGKGNIEVTAGVTAGEQVVNIGLK